MVRLLEAMTSLDKRNPEGLPKPVEDVIVHLTSGFWLQGSKIVIRFFFFFFFLIVENMGSEQNQLGFRTG